MGKTPAWRPTPVTSKTAWIYAPTTTKTEWGFRDVRAFVSHSEGMEAGLLATVVGSPVDAGPSQSCWEDLQHTGIEKTNVILKQTCFSRSESRGRLKDLKLETSLGYTASFLKNRDCQFLLGLRKLKEKPGSSWGHCEDRTAIWGDWA